VDDLRVIEDEKGRERLVWKDWQYEEKRSRNRKAGTLPLPLYGKRSSDVGKGKKEKQEQE
jgi:hypothetical protein